MKNPQAKRPGQPETWLEIFDEAITAGELAAMVEKRLVARRREHDSLNFEIPAYGSTGSLPQLPPDMPQLFDLLHHLRDQGDAMIIRFFQYSNRHKRRSQKSIENISVFFRHLARSDQGQG